MYIFSNVSLLISCTGLRPNMLIIEYISLESNTQSVREFSVFIDFFLIRKYEDALS